MPGETVENGPKGARLPSVTGAQPTAPSDTRSGAHLAHSRWYERERRTAAVLQQVLLPPPLPAVPGVRMAARYLPGSEDLEMGGDWYDAVPVASGGVGLVIGNVMGRGVRAAALMGQLRAAVRAYARLDLSPARTLALLDELVLDLGDSSLVTTAYVVLDVRERTVTYARAGHVPPLLLAPSGELTWLDAVSSPPLGTSLLHEQATIHVPEGAVVALFTDGLVQDRQTDLDKGLDAFASAMRSGPSDADELAGHVLRTLGRDAGSADDVALLLARIG